MSIDLLPPDLSESGAEEEGLKPPGLNLVLCGRRGAGKTSAAEAILGQTDLHPASSSSECVKHQGQVFGRRVSVVELPALSGRPPEEVMEESFRCLSLCDPEGVHAFILVLPVGPLTDEDKGELQTIQDTFSPRVNDFTMILFTVDSDPSAPADVSFRKRDRDVQELLQSCGGRSVVLNIKDKQQIPDLLESVEKMSVGVSRCFSNSMLSMAFTEKMSELHAELQDVKQKSGTEGERLKTELQREIEDDLKKKHREELKSLRAQVEEERKRRVQQLKEKDQSMEKEREERRKEQDEEQKRRKKQEEAQRREWKQKLEASERNCQFERDQREKAEKKLEQVRRETKRDRDLWDKEKDQIWERMHQDLKQNLEEVKQNLEEEKTSHRKLQEEFNWKRKWTYPWFILSGLVLLSVYLFITQRVL